MRRYALFAGSVFYPRGGMNDFIDSFDTREEAIRTAAKLIADQGLISVFWAHLWDTTMTPQTNFLEDVSEPVSRLLEP
jgi:hypothetical protein